MNTVIKRSIYIFLNLVFVFGIILPYLFSFHPDQAIAWGMELSVAKVIANVVVIIGIAALILDAWHIIVYAIRTYGIAMKIKKEDVKKQYGFYKPKKRKKKKKN